MAARRWTGSSPCPNPADQYATIDVRQGLASARHQPYAFWDAMAARLVSDRKGPLRSMSGGDLRDAVEAARHAMDTRRELATDLRAAA